MYNKYKWRIVFTIAVVLLAMPRLSVSLEPTGPKKEKLVIGSLDTAGPVPGINIFRGDFITVTMEVKSEGAVKSEPVKVRISLATDRDGKDIRHEFDIFHDIVLDKGGSAGAGKREFDGFHQVRMEKGGGVWVTGQYVIPYSIAAGDSYYVVVEVSPETKAGEGEKTQMTQAINIPCDALPYFDDSTSAKFPAYNFCGERD